MGFKDLGIKRKLFIIFTVSFIVTGAIIGVFVYSHLEQIEQDTLTKTKKSLSAALKSTLDAKKDTWLTNALQIASNNEIQDALQAGNRERVIKILNGYGQTFKANTGFKNVNIHIITKDLISFVKSWKPESYGEELSYSKAYKEVKKTRKPMVTMEQSPKGLRLKGLFPIIKNDTFLGIANFEGGLNSIKRTLKPNDMEFLYFMDGKFLSLAKKLSDKPHFQNLYLNQKDTDKAF